jgi:hypothetical protein
MTDTSQIRAQIAHLRLQNAPATAKLRYYLFEHDPKRTKLNVEMTDKSKAITAVCQTGADLFRPLVMVYSDETNISDDAISTTLQQALAPRRQYLFSIQPSSRSAVESTATIYSPVIGLVYSLSDLYFKPVTNLLTTLSQSPDGKPRATIRSRDDRVVAEAGVNWMSVSYAEIYVNVVEGARNRGLGKSVVSALSNKILELRRVPLMTVAQDNDISRRLAERLGYSDTGARELSGILQT